MPIQWNDPLPTVALESLASGTPIIAWDRSSMGEIIENGVSGFLDIFHRGNGGENKGY